jgi:hypothetical protein
MPTHWQTHAVEGHRATGRCVQGRLGLYEVTVDGVTGYMTQREADDLVRSLSPASADRDLTQAGAGTRCVASRWPADDGRQLHAAAASHAVVCAHAQPPGRRNQVKGAGHNDLLEFDDCRAALREALDAP